MSETPSHGPVHETKAEDYNFNELLENNDLGLILLGLAIVSFKLELQEAHKLMDLQDPTLLKNAHIALEFANGYEISAAYSDLADDNPFKEELGAIISMDYGKQPEAIQALKSRLRKASGKAASEGEDIAGTIKPVIVILTAVEEQTPVLINQLEQVDLLDNIEPSSKLALTLPMTLARLAVKVREKRNKTLSEDTLATLNHILSIIERIHLQLR